MASNPSHPDAGPSAPHNVPRNTFNMQPATSNTAQSGVNSQTTPQDQGQGQVQSPDELLTHPERQFELLTDGMRRRLEEAVARESRTNEELAAMGVDPEDYDEHGNKYMDTNIDLGPDVEIKEPDSQLSIAKRVKFSKAYAHGLFEGENPYEIENEVDHLTLSLKHTSLDLITALCCNLELAIEIGKHLSPRDIIDTNAPEAGKVFHWKLYGKTLIKDPADRNSSTHDARFLEGRWETTKTNPSQIRLIPGFKYLELVIGRDRYCREIIAMMARMGFRMPHTMHNTLLRLWVLLDIPTTRQRQLFLRSRKYWTDIHLYNAQFFMVKLSMAFTHPFFSPISIDMVKLMMGQKGLYPLWQCLMRQEYRTMSECMELKARYDLLLPRSVWGLIQREKYPSAYGVPVHEVGLGHLEGWGKGVLHLGRPDQILPIEAVSRGLHLDDHITQMMVWGYIDFETGENLVPTEEEMYISDEDEKLNKADNTHHWQRKHALKKRWNELTPEQQQEIKDDDADEHLRAMAWSSVDHEDLDWDRESDDADDESDGEYDINAEINRGYRMPATPNESSSPEDSMSDIPAGGEAIRVGNQEISADEVAETMGGMDVPVRREEIGAWNTTLSELFVNSPPEVNDADYKMARTWDIWFTNGSSGQPPFATAPNTMGIQNQAAGNNLNNNGQ
ncbi:hypothetical protein FOPG_08415 [Fusarium oxysporum f. sp. conglutinans race 2 54008]|uniref:Uncharacterized protein n=1 Tax=Fusarium oxysporum f. sp. conglutinans race 2 54008 TaxID=1089457 RepID=X0HZ26_FUSOX|nr:hypothetical protein FOPG_08415 [Fusarium oxysporum f. sp. conglutinans race 2 54008]KAI8415230.1 hypothetical protein FOFC_04850 [Fusarium oxysporum]